MCLCVCASAQPALEDWADSGPVVQSGGVARPEHYEFPSHQLVQWLQQVCQDPRLQRGVGAMCSEVQWCRMPYAQILALNYQLGGKVCFPTPEAGELTFMHESAYQCV